MKLITTLLVILTLFSISLPVMAQEKTSDKPFADAIITVVKQFISGLDWSTGYVMSIRDNDKQGVVLKASRLIYAIKTDAEDIGLNADCIAVKGSGSSQDLIGMGFSASFKSMSLGIGYLSAGYGWAYTFTPVSLKF
jgi:hypothetical protein